MSNSIDQENNIINIIENFDWDHLSLEQLKLLESQISKAIFLKKRELKLHQSGNISNQKHHYKASLAKIFPSHLRNSLSAYQSCVLIVSLGSKNFCEPERLKASIEWISQRFTSCTVLVTDSIYRLTLEIMGNSKNKDFYEQAISIGKDFIQQNTLLFQKYAKNCNFVFQLTSEVEKLPNFQTYYSQFQQLYQSNHDFTTLVNSFADDYMNRIHRIQELNLEREISLEQQKHLAHTYLLEESALFTCIVEQGSSVFVYPGSIRTFEEIATSALTDIPSFLQQIIWISLRLKRKNSAK